MSKLAEMNIRAKYATYDSEGNKIGSTPNLSDIDLKKEIIAVDSDTFSQYFDVYPDSNDDWLYFRVKKEYSDCFIMLEMNMQDAEFLTHQHGVSQDRNMYFLGTLSNPLCFSTETMLNAMNIDYLEYNFSENYAYPMYIGLGFGQGQSTILIIGDTLTYQRAL